MRHHVDGKKLGRTSSHRKAMFSNMAASLILHDKIETTLPKARELKRLADRLITIAKQRTLHARRRAFAIIRNDKAIKRLFAELVDRFAARNGGYTRILKLGSRHGDAAPMAAIEYLPAERQTPHVSQDDKAKKADEHKKEKHAQEGKDASKGKMKRLEKKTTSKSQKTFDVKKPAKRSSPAHRSSKGE